MSTTIASHSKIFFLLVLASALVIAPQVTAQSGLAASPSSARPRVLHLFPDIQTIEPGQVAPRLSVRDKFRRFSSQTFDPSFIPVAAAIAGLEQAGNRAPHFGQGGGPYAQRFGAGCAGFVTASLFTNAVVPSLTHEDPRYYRKGHGSAGSRIWYAVSRTLITRSDSGGNTLNVSQIGGIAASTGIANLYYPSQDRTVHENVSRLGVGIAASAGINLLREFGKRR